jgi:glutamate-ammonia-ligase adenylyltransferase
MKAFDEYQQKHAWTWEHQALVRARAVCGSDDTIHQYQVIRQQILSQPRDAETLQKDVREMRQKMRDHLGEQKEGQITDKYHLKQDKGGIVDIEFIVQYGVLANVQQHPSLLTYTDNMRILDGFAETGLMAVEDTEKLQGIYLNYRAESHRRALQKEKLVLDVDAQQQLNIAEQKAEVIRLWDKWLE